MNDPHADDRRWMAVALRRARRYVGATAPNPAVGAVVVKDGRQIGAGAHRAAGSPHAEVDALTAAGAAARGATLYVTLEPCAHHGRTPPCTNAIVAAGIRRVVIGCADPHGAAAGGAAALHRAGIEVVVGVRENEARDLITDFTTWIGAHRPYVIHKAALTLDGATASAGTGNEAISGPASRRAVHRLRARVDAVVVGGATARLDDPDLRPRGVRVVGPTPWRVVVAASLPPAEGKLFDVAPERTWWLVGTDPGPHGAAWEAAGARVERVAGEGRPAPGAVLAALWDGGIYRVLLEGGATLARAFLDAGRVDWLCLVYGPRLAGGRPDVGLYGGDPARPLTAGRRFVARNVRRRGDDIWVEGPLGP